MNWCRNLLVLTAVAAVACGSRVDDKSTKNGSFNGTANADDNNTESNNPNGDPNAQNANIQVDPAKCGDGALDPGELCDPAIAEGGGACPTSCAAGACGTAQLVGSAEQCNAQCVVEAATCADGDGCCPQGCTSANDNDCEANCIPTSCANAGAECGQIPDGCGGVLSCQDTCGVNEMCQGNMCVSGPDPGQTIGTDCMDFPDCSTPQEIAVCILPPAWPGGYCSEVCNTPDNPDGCPVGSHCVPFDGLEVCMLDCNSNADCEAGYVCRQLDAAGPTECVPPPPASGSGEIGDPCTSDSDCDGESFCQTSFSDPQSGATITFPGGSCTLSCTPIIGMECPVGSVCGLFTGCMPACTSDADCRAGYGCQDPGLGFAYCFPN